jgi:hypothetical protein
MMLPRTPPARLSSRHSQHPLANSSASINIVSSSSPARSSPLAYTINNNTNAIVEQKQQATIHQTPSDASSNWKARNRSSSSYATPTIRRRMWGQDNHQVRSLFIFSPSSLRKGLLDDSTNTSSLSCSSLPPSPPPASTRPLPRPTPTPFPKRPTPPLRTDLILTRTIPSRSPSLDSGPVHPTSLPSETRTSSCFPRLRALGSTSSRTNSSRR